MLPKAFLQRMEHLLGNEYPDFLREISKEKPEKALRLNLRKTDRASFLKEPPFPVMPIPYSENGFYTKEEHPGREAAHHAGMFYMQDPSAQATLQAIEIPVNARILDACAAPGGKSTEAAARAKEGILVANEYVSSRCKTLVGNIERCGLPNVLVLHTDCFHLRQLYPSYFDIVLLDAPCSGEGMLRKYDVAGEEWSLENVRLCAQRQKELLLTLCDCLRPGGTLLYSTCTFSPEENEENVAAFLRERPDFSLVPVRDILLPYTAPGIPVQDAPCDTRLCRRFYPHISPGEGQFIACLRRNEEKEGAKTPGFSDVSSPLSPSEKKTVERFLQDTMLTPARYRCRKVGDKLTVLPENMAVPPNHVFLSGVLLGEIRKEMLFPHHQFMMAFGQDAKRKICLDRHDSRTGRYLRGEEIPAECENGYAAVLYENATLGFAKVTNGIAKNHYPKGLRNLK